MVHVKSNGPSNAKKTEQLLIVTRQILQLVNQPILDLYLTGNRVDRGTQRQFSENICSEDDLRSRVFGAFVVKFLACLPLLGFSNV